MEVSVVSRLPHTSDVGSSGSYAAAKVHDQVRQDKKHADMRLIQQTVQQLLDTLCDLNGLPSAEFIMESLRH
jgi:phage gp29-like protein